MGSVRFTLKALAQVSPAKFKRESASIGATHGATRTTPQSWAFTGRV